MNEANTLIESLLRQTQAEADGILAEARAKADGILTKAREELKAKAAGIDAVAARRGEIEVRRIATEAELNARRELLRAKVALLDEAFAGALQRLLTLPEPQWRDFVRRLLLAETVSGAEEVKVAAGQEERFRSLLAEVNKALKSAGKPGELRLAGASAPIEGGFVLAGPDYSVDCSFRTILAERRPFIEPEAAKVLFGE